jgi:hypothetical protein
MTSIMPSTTSSGSRAATAQDVAFSGKRFPLCRHLGEFDSSRSGHSLSCKNSRPLIRVPGSRLIFTHTQRNGTTGLKVMKVTTGDWGALRQATCVPHVASRGNGNAAVATARQPTPLASPVSALRGAILGLDGQRIHAFGAGVWGRIPLKGPRGRRRRESLRGVSRPRAKRRSRSRSWTQPPARRKGLSRLKQIGAPAVIATAVISVSASSAASASSAG